MQDPEQPKIYQRLKQPFLEEEKDTPEKRARFEAQKQYLNNLYHQTADGLCVLTHKPCCDPQAEKCGQWIDFLCDYNTVCFRHAERSPAWQAAWDLIDQDRTLNVHLGDALKKANDLYPKHDYETDRMIKELHQQLDNPDYVKSLKAANDYIASLEAEKPTCLQGIVDPTNGQVRICRFSHPLFEVTASIEDPELNEVFTNMAKTEGQIFHLSQEKMVTTALQHFPKTQRTAPARIEQPGIHTTEHWQCPWGMYPCYSAIEIFNPVTGYNLVLGEFVVQQALQTIEGIVTVEPYRRLLLKDWQASKRDLDIALKEYEEFIAHAGTTAMGGSGMTSKAGLHGNIRPGTGSPIDREVTQEKREREVGIMSWDPTPELAPDPSGKSLHFVPVVRVKRPTGAKGMVKELLVDVSDAWTYLDPVTNERKISRNAINKANRLTNKPIPLDRQKKEFEIVERAIAKEDAEGTQRMITEAKKPLLGPIIPPKK
jgi:hypothetical protein